MPAQVDTHRWNRRRRGQGGRARRSRASRRQRQRSPAPSRLGIAKRGDLSACCCFFARSSEVGSVLQVSPTRLLGEWGSSRITQPFVFYFEPPPPSWSFARTWSSEKLPGFCRGG